MTALIEQGTLLLGDEAIAQAALDAGLSGAYGYPGTPSTEIIEYIQKAPEALAGNVHREWSANEKTAMEEALGMSYCGLRSMVTMKHVGLNVASDAFVNSAITGVNGGMLVVVADDPSMHSSQNEQDSRYYARFAHVPLLEPASQQEAYDMTYAAFKMSEELALPVMLRLTTRLAHSRAEVRRQPVLPKGKVVFPTNKRQFILLPANARRNYVALLDKQVRLRSLSLESTWNESYDGTDKSCGIIVAGVAFNYLKEIYGGTQFPHPVVRVSQYPVPGEMITRLARECDELLVIEEGYPFIEEMLRGIVDMGLKVRGRLSGALPRTGELSPDSVGAALGFDTAAHFSVPDVVAMRPPSLCKGCPHTDSYLFLNKALENRAMSRVFSDIGCYTLGALPPFDAINSCVDMGASITMAKGAADAGVRPVVAVIGDSTFTHSGITGLLDAIYENSPITVLILDNEATAMTGAQDSIATGRLERLVLGLGVDPEHFHVVTPLKNQHEKNVEVLERELAHEGTSVIISKRVCIQATKRNRG
ncbi:MAG: indolepyruvate ferredoxin oxidoreductase, alpha subunit [Candidatus Sumerlaeota bacterium]|nr:indolepyruvate ferredoxin oxidoreductase, alpha subunit [Candidatus Sumerlaeota bacterium]